MTKINDSSLNQYSIVINIEQLSSEFGNYCFKKQIGCLWKLLNDRELLPMKLEVRRPELNLKS